MTILVLLLKVSLLFGLALACLPLMRRATAALRHLICAMALMGGLVFPLTLAFTPKAIPIRLPVVFMASATKAASATPGGFPLYTVLLTLWGIGALALFGRLALGHLRIAQLLQTAERTSDHEPVYLADVSAPLICGLFSTAILLPRGSTEWQEDQRAAALRHEIAHMKRKDLWTSLIAHAACAIYWFHPLAWAVALQLRKEQEAACDDAVLSTGFEPATYAEALIATARQLTSTSLIGCQMTSRGTLRARIARLLDVSLPRTSSMANLGRAAALSLALLAVIGLIYAEPSRDVFPYGPTGKIYKMTKGMKAPMVLKKIDPVYTDEARSSKVQGTVMLSVVVGTDGVAHDINVVRTPGWGLGVTAVNAVKEWKFRPGQMDGQPVAVRASIEVNFKLL